MITRLSSFILTATLMACGISEGSTQQALTLVSIIDLGELGDPDNSIARDVNSSGQVVGVSLTDSGLQGAFLWTAPGPMIHLDPGNPNRSSHGLAINDHGEVVGQLATNQNRMGFYWSSGSGLVELAFGTEATAWKINNSGQVAGVSRPQGASAEEVFIWQAPNGPAQSLGSLGHESFSALTGINELGQVIGLSRPPGSGLRAFMSDPATNSLVDLSTLGGHPQRTSLVEGLNELGQAVGAIEVIGYQAMLWQLPNTAIALGHLPGHDASRALDINDAGQIVGISGVLATNEVVPVMWENGEIYVLESLDTTGSSLSTKINSAGIAAGVHSSEIPRGLVWSADGLTETGSLPGDVNSLVTSKGGTEYFAGGSWVDSSHTNAVRFQVSVSGSPDDAAEDVQDIVDDLVDSGSLGAGNGNALVSKLEAIQNQIERGNCNAARNQLNAFINQVESLHAEGSLSDVDAQNLLNAAQTILVALQDC